MVFTLGCFLFGFRIHMIPLSNGSPVNKATKVLHFPKDQYIGRLCIEDPCLGSAYLEGGRDLSLPLGLNPKLVDIRGDWDFADLAQGDVIVPAGQKIRLTTILQPRREDLARLSMGSRMSLRNRFRSDPYDLSGLSGLDPNDLYMLHVSSMIARADADQRVLVPISRLTGLHILELSQTGVTNKGMQYLKDLRSLRALALKQEPSIGDPGLVVLKDLPALEYLACDIAITDTGLKHLGQLPNLRWLQIKTDRIHGPGLAELVHCPRLERLCLSATNGLTDRHIRYLEGLRHLKSLTFWGSADRLTDASLASIAQLENLEELYFILTGPKFTGTGLAHLKRFKHLCKLDLGFTQISDARYLMELPRLEFAKPVALTAENMKALSSLRHLKSLGITLPSPPDGSIDDPVAASYLGALSSLEELSFCGSAPGRFVSDEEVACLESLGCLKKLYIDGSKHLTDRSLTSISKLDQLESLDFGVFDNEGVSKSGLKQLSGLTNLHTLDVKVHPVVTGPANEVTLDFSTLTNLNTLALSGISLKDADLASLAGLQHLECLTLEGTFTEGGLRFLRNLSNLKHLSISGLSCTAGHHLDYLGSLVKLNDLTLRGRITDAALRSMAGLPSLWSLRVVTNEPIWPKTVTHLKQNLPAIEYIHTEKSSQPVRLENRQSLRQRQRSLVNPPRTNRRTSRDRRRRR